MICFVLSIRLPDGSSPAVTSTVLFFLTKKRQWKIREGLRRSASRVKSAVKVLTPRTPHKATFSPIEKRTRSSAAERFGRKSGYPNAGPRTDLNRSEESERFIVKNRDLEKGIPGATSRSVGGERDSQERDGKPRPHPPPVAIPQSAFDMDSPVTPIWKKIFGR